SWGGGTNVSFSSPYEILAPTNLGSQILRVYANDSSGNIAVADFVFDIIEISQTSGESSTIVTSDTSQSSTITSSDTIDSQTTSTDQTSSSTTSDNQNSEFAEIIITFIALITILSSAYLILRK
ncbi:MAG: hypothetical protein GPJ54_15605, partial [Candidatus Heimdallarchaeota archaeon]|nr:hypothetical protein [Candidatus Heimdallarchaeota archaeon]